MKWYHWLLIIALALQFTSVGKVLAPFLILYILWVAFKIILGGLGITANYCPSCGAKVAFGKYCKNCGKRI